MRIGIIGAGVSGLAAAWALRRAGHEITVFERAEQAGGLISTFDFDRTRIERYYHFLCRGDKGYIDLCGELGLADRIRWKPARTGFYYAGRDYPFTTPVDLLRFSPLSAFERLRLGAFALEARMREEWAQLDAIAAKPWLIDRLGRKAYDMIWHPLLAFKFGVHHERISAAWVWHRVHRVARSKGRMGYLEGGSALLLDTLVAKLREAGVRIEEGCGVDAIAESGGRAAGLHLSDGSAYECDRVISAAPIPAAAKLVAGAWPGYAAQLASVEYIGVVCAVFKLARPVTNNFWLNIHDDRMTSNGLIEFTNLYPLLPRPQSIVYVPFYVATDTELYRATDETVFAQTWEYLRAVNPKLTEGDLLAWSVSRAPYAQAVCPVDFLTSRPPAEGVVPGLSLLDSIYQYPEDRTQAGLIAIARDRALAAVAAP